MRSTPPSFFLKLRASWGRNGNISVLGGYPYAATINKGTSAWYQFDVVDNGVQYGSAPSGLPNTNLRWEKSEQWDLGLDARLFNNRLTFGVDYFNKQTKDLLFSVSVPPELGVSSTMANGGNILNTGLEFELGWKDQIGDFGYAVNANFSSLHNEVISLAEGAAPSYRSDASSTNYQIRTAFEPGFPVWYLNGYIYEGMDAEGNPLYRNKAGEVVDQVSTDDMQYIGQGTPKFTYGINVNLNWRGFDLAIFGAGAGGNSILPVLHRTGFKNNLKWYLDNSSSRATTSASSSCSWATPCPPASPARSRSRTSASMCRSTTSSPSPSIPASILRRLPPTTPPAPASTGVPTRRCRSSSLVST